MRMVAVMHNAQQRQNHGEDDALFHAHQHHHAGRGRGQQNSPGLSRRIAWSPRKSTSLMATINTMAPRTHFGRYRKGWVKKSSTSATTAAVATCATWLRPPELSIMVVCVGLPFTTNEPLSAAAAFAADRPARSAFSSSGSWLRAA